MTLRCAASLLLADGRLPTGGHAHSGGLEAAVAAGAVRDAEDLLSWLTGRLAAVGEVDSAFAVASWARAGSDLTSLATELSARIPSPAQRAASRAQGRGMLRVARRCWPSDAALTRLGPDPLWPLALGVAGRAGGLTADDVARVASMSAIQGPAWAATRLLGLDPFDVAACLASLAPAVDAQARAVMRWADPSLDPASLPSGSALAIELSADDHARWEVRLFAS